MPCTAGASILRVDMVWGRYGDEERVEETGRKGVLCPRSLLARFWRRKNWGHTSLLDHVTCWLFRCVVVSLIPKGKPRDNIKLRIDVGLKDRHHETMYMLQQVCWQKVTHYVENLLYWMLTSSTMSVQARKIIKELSNYMNIQSPPHS